MRSCNLLKRFKFLVLCLRETAATPSDELLAELNQHGGNVNAKNEYGFPHILWAALDGKLQDVKYLVEHDADIEARNNYGTTAVIFAAWHDKLEVTTFKC